jgi:phosphoribosylamine--glycine ligase
MIISLISSHSSYHHLAQLLVNEGNEVFHFGASSTSADITNYHPIPINLPIAEAISDHEIDFLIEKLLKIESDFILASGIPISRNKKIHNVLTERKIPYFFVSPEFTILEIDKFKTKKMLQHLKIPTPDAISIDGKYLFENFKKIPRPFVVKLNYIFHYGKQTIIVNDDNFEEAYLDLFSTHIDLPPRLTNISFDANITLEKFVKLKREYSYHLVANKTGWKYLGSARDYKRSYENDIGFNTLGMGAYNTDDIDLIMHEYSDKIIKFLNDYLKINYKGFMFIGVGIDENNNPHVLEINTRAGDPELQVILNSINNNLTEFFYLLSKDENIPDIQFNTTKSVTVKLMNKFFEWNKPARHLPAFDNIPKDIIHSLDGGLDFYITHSVFTAKTSSLEESSKKIYNYLNTQMLGQFFYRKDIGILK